MRGAPQRRLARAMVRTSFATSQIDGRSTSSTASGLPVLEGAEALPVPANDGLRLNDLERFAPPRPPLREPHAEEAIELSEPRSLRAAADQGELLS